MFHRKLHSLIIGMLTFLFGFIPAVKAEDKTLLIIGQDLKSVRDYIASECCPTPGGVTTYLGLYDLLDEAKGFGGSGLGQDGTPIDLEAEWGGGPSNAVKAAREFPGSVLAIGLSFTENDHPGAIADMLSGKHDDKIGRLALLLKLIEKPVLLRVGYEFDGAWNQGYGEPDQYRAAYRYIVDGLRGYGVNNAQFVWQTATSPVDDYLDGHHENLADWYPGDMYVDWVGTSWFVLPDDNPHRADRPNLPTGRDLHDEALEFARKANKPVIIAEASTQGFDIANRTRRNVSINWDGPAGENLRSMTPLQIWNTWYKPFFSYIEANRDVIKAVAYINANWDTQGLWDSPYEHGYWGDSRVEINQAIRGEWLREISRPAWTHGGDLSTQQDQ